MGDLISFLAGVLKDAVVDWATKHPLEVIALGAVLVAGYYMGRYDELKVKKTPSLLWKMVNVV